MCTSRAPCDLARCSWHRSGNRVPRWDVRQRRISDRDTAACGNRRAVNGLGRPPFTTAVAIHTRETRSSHVSEPRCRNDPVITKPYGDHGHSHITTAGQAAVKRTADRDFKWSGRRDSYPRPSPWQREEKPPLSPSQSPDVGSCPPARPPSPPSPPIPYTGLPSQTQTSHHDGDPSTLGAHRRRPQNVRG